MKIRDRQEQLQLGLDWSKDNVLNELFIAHHNLRTEMNRAHNPVILQVPVEITSYIFELCIPLPTAFTSGSDVRVDIWKAPSQLMVLGAVCKEWRRRAWSTPRLWTAVYVTLDYPNIPWVYEFTQDWLKRSGSLSLSIHVGLSRRRRTELPGQSHTLVALINDFSDRWQHLDLDVPTPLVSEFSGCGSGQSALQSLRIRPIGYRDEYPMRFELRKQQPQLHSVCLSYIRIHEVSISWARVTYVDIHEIDIEDCITLFQLAPQLTRCSLSMIGPGWQPPVDAGITQHPRLEDLHIAHPMMDADTILDLFSFPALRRLSLDLDEKQLPVASLALLLDRSSCRLQELRIINADYTEVELANMCLRTRTLQVLDIAPLEEHRGFARTLFQRLAETASWSVELEGEFLPALHTLKYHFGHCYTPDGMRLPIEIPWQTIPSAINPLMLFRDHRRRPLQRFHVIYDRYSPRTPLVTIPQVFVRRFQVVKELGIDLRVRYSDDLEGWDAIEAAARK